MNAYAHDVIVVGGGYAGVMAANRLPHGTRVLLVDAKEHFVHRVRLHELAAGGRPQIVAPFRRMLGSRVGFRAGRASRIEPGMVVLSDGTELRARHILLATGSDRAERGSIASIDGALRMRARLARTEAGTRIAVRGAGLTGIECAAEIAYRRPDLIAHLNGLSPVGAGLPAGARHYLRAALTTLGVVLDEEVQPRGGFSIDATGLRRSPIPDDAGLDLDELGRIHADATLEAAPGVWTAGDAAVLDTHPQLRASCAAAIPMGAHAADNIARALRGEPPERFDFGYSYRCISLGRRSGLILSVDGCDSPTGDFTPGVRAALVEAIVCAAARHIPSSWASRYRWSTGDRGDQRSIRLD